MDLREFRIASFFTLVLAVLFLAAGSQQHVSQPGGMVVSLLADDF